MSRELQLEKIKSVIVRGANWVGDAVMTVPALRELRALLPEAHITLATRPWAEGIFEGADFIDDILLLKDKGRGAGAIFNDAREWRAHHFDMAILLPNAFAPALVAAIARVPARVGYASQARSKLLTHAIPLPDWRSQRHEVFYYLNIIAEIKRLLHVISSSESVVPQLDLTVNETRINAAREMLREHGVQLGRTLVALCPGSTNSRAKRWPAERFAALADTLIEQLEADVFLIGAGEELGVSDDVIRHMRNRPALLTGKTDLSTTAALLSVADLLVTNDTGPAHVAAAVGCPVVVIFGPTNPLTTRPYSPLAEVVRDPPFCAPCMLRDCPIDHRCMTAISADDVFARAARTLEARRKAEVV